MFSAWLIEREKRKWLFLNKELFNHTSRLSRFLWWSRFELKDLSRMETLFSWKGRYKALKKYRSETVHYVIQSMQLFWTSSVNTSRLSKSLDCWPCSAKERVRIYVRMLFLFWSFLDEKTLSSSLLVLLLLRASRGRNDLGRGCCYIGNCTGVYYSFPSWFKALR